MGLGWDRRLGALYSQLAGAEDGSRNASTPYLLLIENNDDDVFLTLRSLARKQFGIPVRVVDDAAKALAVLSESDVMPLAVLVSYRLPRMSGLDLIDTLRANPRMKDTPAILLTASENERDHILNSAHAVAEVDGCMVKPVHYERLMEQLHNLELINPPN